MRIFKYLRPYWFLTLLAPLTMLGEVVMDLFQPQLMARIVDIGLGEGNNQVIIQTGLLMLVLVVIGGICGFASAGFASASSQSFADDLRRDCFKKVMSLSFEQTDKFTTGSLVTRITNDITMIQNMVASAVRMFVRTFFLFVGGIIMMLSINIRFGLILLVTLPLEILCIFIFFRKIPPMFVKVQERLDQVNIIMQENVGGSRVVKAYNKEEYESNRFEEANVRLTTINLKVQKTMAFLSPILMIFMNLVIVSIIYYGGMQVRIPNSTFLVGEVMAAISYVGQILMSVMMFGMMFLTITRAKASIIRVNQILDSEEIIKDGLHDEVTINGKVEFKEVCFQYPESSDKLVLKNISITVEPGSTLAILGATGCGKTSFINLIPRFYDVTEGEVLIDDINVKEYKLTNLRMNIGFVLQKTELFTGSIKDNICWGKQDATMEEIKKACQIAQADDFIMSFNDGYDTIIGEKGSSLSGGQKQRLAIARAIIRKPKILIFDDATSALDLSTEANLYKALRENLQDTTIILVAQRVASAKGAEKIMVIDNGKIASYGSHEELIHNSPIYQDIYYSQLRDNGGEE